MRTRHQRTLIQSLCNHRALLLRETKNAHLLEMFRRLQSGRESSSSSRTNDAPSSVRGMHATRTVQLIEDRDGRGLTEEIIEENLVRRRVTMHSVRIYAARCSLPFIARFIVQNCLTQHPPFSLFLSLPSRDAGPKARRSDETKRRLRRVRVTHHPKRGTIALSCRHSSVCFIRLER